MMTACERDIEAKSFVPGIHKIPESAGLMAMVHNLLKLWRHGQEAAPAG
jgi:ribosomal protein S4E